jgi:hypothetical protein
MAIIQKQPRRIVIDLSGPDGNAFVLIGYARQYARDLGLDGMAITAEMRSGDYENLINVFDKYFGEYVDLER